MEAVQLNELALARTCLGQALSRVCYQSLLTNPDPGLFGYNSLAALELSEQALDDVVRDVPSRGAGADAAALDDDGIPRRDELGVVAGLEEQGVFGISCIAHPVWSHRHLPPILRRIRKGWWSRDF